MATKLIEGRCAYPQCRRPADMMYCERPLCSQCFGKPTENLHRWLGASIPTCLCGNCRPKHVRPEDIKAPWEI